MRWTRERPSVPGWYWRRDKDYNDNTPEICRIVLESTGLHCYFATEEDKECDLVSLDSGEWQGPIRPEG